MDQVTAYTKAGGGCLTCFEPLEGVLARVNAEMVAEGILADHEAYRLGVADPSVLKKKPSVSANATMIPLNPLPPTRPAAKTSPLDPAAGTAPAMTNLQRIRLIEQTIEDLRPSLKADGGDCELVDVDGNTVFVRLSGACVGCQMASVTVAGIQQRLSTRLGIPLRIVPVGKNGH
jgi:NifU-like protein